MALFKILRGNATNLSSVAKKDGYAYFCTDTHDFYIDYTKADGSLERAQLNAYAADKLTTGRTIGLGTAVSSTATTFDGSKNITIPVTEIKEAYLTWGGKNLTGLVGPLGASLSAEHSANRLAYFPPAGIKFEHSVDGGATWEEKSTYGDVYKTRLVTLSTSVPVTLNAPVSTSQMMRCTITSQDGTVSGSGRVYTRARKMLIDVNTPHQLQVKIERKKGSSSSWDTVGGYTISGWGGWNEIPLDAFSFGGTSSQTGNYWQIRLTFSILTIHTNTSYANTKPSIQGIRLFGDTMWATPSALARTGHLYTYDEAQQATFPASIIQNSTSGQIYSKGSLKADGATTLGGTLNVTGKTTLKETATGALTASSISSTGALTVTGNSTLSGSLTVKGNTTLGDATSDTVTIKGPVTAENNLTVKGSVLLGDNASDSVALRAYTTISGNIEVLNNSYLYVGQKNDEKWFYVDNSTTSPYVEVYDMPLVINGGGGISIDTGDLFVGGASYLGYVEMDGQLDILDDAEIHLYDADGATLAKIGSNFQSTGGFQVRDIDENTAYSSLSKTQLIIRKVENGSATNMIQAKNDGTLKAATSVTSPSFIGDLTGNADTATTAESAEQAETIAWCYFDATGIIS